MVVAVHIVVGSLVVGSPVAGILEVAAMVAEMDASKQLG